MLSNRLFRWIFDINFRWRWCPELHQRRRWPHIINGKLMSSSCTSDGEVNVESSAAAPRTRIHPGWSSARDQFTITNSSWRTTITFFSPWVFLKCKLTCIFVENSLSHHAWGHLRRCLHACCNNQTLTVVVAATAVAVVFNNRVSLFTLSVPRALAWCWRSSDAFMISSPRFEFEFFSFFCQLMKLCDFFLVNYMMN